MKPSIAGLQNPPDRVKTLLIPLSFNALAINAPPLIFFSILVSCIHKKFLFNYIRRNFINII